MPSGMLKGAAPGMLGSGGLADPRGPASGASSAAGSAVADRRVKSDRPPAGLSGSNHQGPQGAHAVACSV
jgi:hypothetical protein